MKILFCDDDPNELRSTMGSIRTRINLIDQWMEIKHHYFKGKNVGEIADAIHNNNNHIDMYLVNDGQINSLRNEQLISYFDAIVCDISWGKDNNTHGKDFCESLVMDYPKYFRRICCISRAGVDNATEAGRAMRSLDIFRTGHERELLLLPPDQKIYGCTKSNEDLAPLSKWIKKIYDELITSPTGEPTLAYPLNKLMLQGPIEALFHGRKHYKYANEYEELPTDYCDELGNYNGDISAWNNVLLEACINDLNRYGSVHESPKHIAHHLLLKESITAQFESIIKRDLDIINQIYYVMPYFRLSDNESLAIRLQTLINREGVFTHNCIKVENSFFDVSKLSSTEPITGKAFLPSDPLKSILEETMKYADTNSINSWLFTAESNDHKNKNIIWILANDGNGFETANKMKDAASRNGYAELAFYANVFVANVDCNNELNIFEIYKSGESKQICSNNFIYVFDTMIEFIHTKGTVTVFVMPSVKQQK